MKITLYDSDFVSYYHIFGTTLYDLFIWSGKFPEEKDLSQLKKYIYRLWWSLENTSNYLGCEDPSTEFSKTSSKMFKDNLDISIVKFKDIITWDSNEDIYIPLTSDSCEILLK